DERYKHDEYVAGVLATQGRTGEARAMLTAAIRDYPPDIKQSRLGKLLVDASLIALETDDVALSTTCATALDRRDVRALEAPVQSAAAFARGAHALLTGGTVDPVPFPLGAESPAYVLLAVRGKDGADAL